MTTVRLSFLAKLDRAEHHLVELKEAIRTYGGTDKRSRPYTVRKSVEGKRKVDVHRLHFTRSVANTDIPLIAADAIYNLRSSLDHLISQMVPSEDRGSVMFPIFWKGVWGPCIGSENEQRRKDRHRWLSVTKTLPDPAVTFLKKLQPPDEAPNEETPHGLRTLNRLSNRDRHEKLPLVANGVDDLITRWRLPGGKIVDGYGKAKEGFFVEDNAQIHGVPTGGVYVECYGTPCVLIRTAMNNPEDGTQINLPIDEFVSDTLDFLRDTVMPRLVSFVRKPGR